MFETSSLTAYVTSLHADALVVAINYLDNKPALVFAHGLIRWDGRDFVAHPDGAVLCVAGDEDRLFTGGDDGQIIALSARGEIERLVQETGWIDALTVREGNLAWSVARSVRARDAKGQIRSFTADASVRGLSFLHKGYRLACAHYNGVSLWFPNLDTPPQILAWKGAHFVLTLSPDGRFLVTAMQENALHGWRLADARHMQMTGYPAKTRSLSWSHDGEWLATSGAEACVLWPFKDKDGPMNKPPRECGVRQQRVTAVAFHPRTWVVAIGYADGLVLLCRLIDGAEILVREPAPGEGAISVLTWDKIGARLAFASERGYVCLLTLPA